METKVVEKFSWKEYIARVESRGYEFLQAGRCECGGKACQIHSSGVVHMKCDSCNLSGTGFGGPNVRSWSGAVAWGELSQEEQQKQKEKQEKEMKEKQDRLKAYLLEE